MTNEQRQFLLLHYNRKADYWSSQYSLEAEEQYQHALKMIKFLVTKMDTCKATLRPNGPNIVFPCL